jgi:LytS/YehU family sensor histidine kinase
MLLIPFIENSFKHGINNSRLSFVTINISVANNLLALKVENSNHTSVIEKDKASGIGLVNVKRRLDLLYPDKHQLDIIETEKIYSVELQIKLR